MRLLGLYLAMTLCVAGCGGKESAPAAKEEKDPVFVGDPTAPLEVRVYKDAKQVKKQVDTQRKEEKQLLKESD